MSLLFSLIAHLLVTLARLAHDDPSVPLSIGHPVLTSPTSSDRRKILAPRRLRSPTVVRIRLHS